MANVVDVMKIQERDFDWFSKKKKSKGDRRIYTDVSINPITIKDPKKNPYYHLIFRNDCFKNLGSDYFEMAVKDNRLYFRGSETGLKLSGEYKTYKKYNRYSISSDTRLNDFLGNYPLLFDEKYHLYYIENTSF